MSAPAIDDRFGLGWRPELALAILAARDRIDVVELTAEDAFEAPAARRRALRTLARQVPLLLHGTGLGPVSVAPAESARLERLARLAGEVEPESWSEHLAFVRAGGHEIGHLAAPPRRPATLDGAVRNIERAARVVGAAPDMENIATLIDPPASSMDEWEFIGAIVRASGCGLLLDLHNLYVNATNHGREPFAELARVPLERVRTVHIAGGRSIDAPREGEAPRLLDDHLHAVPDPVFELLAAVASRVPGPLTVVLERDGAYPPFEELLAEIEAARRAVRRGRERRASFGACLVLEGTERRAAPDAPSDTGLLETLLARAFVDDDALQALERDPAGVALAAGLDPETAAALGRMDRSGLRFAARSFARKRALKRGQT